MKNTFATEFPNLIKEWDFKKNGNLTLEDVPPKGRLFVWWVCKKGHSYKAKLAHKSNGKSCPVCSLYSNSITKKTPTVLKLWDYRKNTESQFLTALIKYIGLSASTDIALIALLKLLLEKDVAVALIVED